MMETLERLVRDEYKTLVEVRAQQTEIIRALKEIVADHEKRLRFVERTVSYGFGAVAIVAFLIKMLK